MRGTSLFANWLCLVLLVLLPTGCRAEVKEPAVAGAFYTANPKELAQQVDRFLARVETPPVAGRLVALVAPHAGYEFSGQVAAYAYKRLQGSGVKTVVLIGPSHHADVTGAAVWAEGSLRTPLGNVPVNEKLARSLLDEKAGITFNRTPFAREHSLEVQLPFLQRTLKEFSVVPILIGSPTRESYTALVERLTAALKGDDRAIIVASTDLSHYHDRKAAAEKDRRVVDAMTRLSLAELERTLSSREGEMCGGFPALYVMAVARNLGATHGVLLRQGDSGDANGDTRRVVGYAAIGFYAAPLNNSQKNGLLDLARRTVTAQVNGKPLPEPISSDPRLTADGASFVTLKRKNGELRGCIGTIFPVMPLEHSIIHNAVSAAVRDPRFPPVRPEELPGLDCEVTVLSPLEPISDIAAITVGTHGIYLEKEGRSAVFLPQVPVEQGWDLPTYLRELARKAGLPDDGWRGARLSRFTAEVIH